MLLAVPYLLIASICTNAIAGGGAGWLHLVVLWAVWNSMKFIIMGPVSLVLLVRARLQEWKVRRDSKRHGYEDEDEVAQEPIYEADRVSSRHIDVPRQPPAKLGV